MRTVDQFESEVLSMLACEHDTNDEPFVHLVPWIRAAHATEGQIEDSVLEDLCCGEENEERRELEKQYPKLTRIFESVFDGEEPFPVPGVVYMSSVFPDQEMA